MPHTEQHIKTPCWKQRYCVQEKQEMSLLNQSLRKSRFKHHRLDWVKHKSETKESCAHFCWSYLNTAWHTTCMHGPGAWRSSAVKEKGLKLQRLVRLTVTYFCSNSSRVLLSASCALKIYCQYTHIWAHRICNWITVLNPWEITLCEAIYLTYILLHYLRMQKRGFTTGFAIVFTQRSCCTRENLEIWLTNRIQWA